MEIEKESNREAFEKEMLNSRYVAGNISAFWDKKTQDYDIAITELRMAWHAWQAAKAQAVPECTWTKNEDGYFDASCGQSFVFSEPEDKPSSHEFTHCCFCGGKLIEAQEPNND